VYYEAMKTLNIFLVPISTPNASRYNCDIKDDESKSAFASLAGYTLQSSSGTDIQSLGECSK